MITDPYIAFFIIMPIGVLSLMGYYAYSCWGKWSRGEGLTSNLTVIDGLLALAVMLVLSSGSEDQNRIMFVATGGVLVMLILRLINSSVGWIVTRKLRQRAQASPS